VAAYPKGGEAASEGGGANEAEAVFHLQQFFSPPSASMAAKQQSKDREETQTNLFLLSLSLSLQTTRQ